MRANDGLKAEIQERKRFEATLKLANRKLGTLSSVTRNDIFNQISAIILHVSRAEEMVKDPAVLEHLRKIEQSTQIIQKQIRFARDYQDIGLHTPQWQNIDVTIRNAIAGLDIRGIRVERDVGNLEIYADLLLERVFSAIVENTVVHGLKATYIRFSAQETGEGLTIFCQDDGAGVPAGVKEGMSTHDYSRNTGYGLFLASEILGMTELSVVETGEPGSGARFEIRVPKGAYRYHTEGLKILSSCQQFSGPGKTDMNRFVSQSNVYDGHPPQGLSEARRGRGIFKGYSHILASSFVNDIIRLPQ